MPYLLCNGLADKFDLVAAVGEQCRALLAASSRRVEAETGTVFQIAGGRATRVLLVQSGSLHVIHSDRAGNRRIVRILGQWDHHGLIEFTLGCPARYRVEAAEHSVLTEIPFDALESIALQCPDLQRGITAALARKTVESEHLLVSLTSEDVTTRVVSYLLSLPRVSDAAGRALVRLPVTQVDLASHLGTTPETLSRRLHELMDSGAVARTTGRGFLLNEELLASY